MFFVPEIIEKKRNGGKLSGEEIRYLIEGYVRGEIPDYQVSAFLMAVYFRGMDEEETTELTMAMARSGEMVDLSAIEGVKVDKHSSGGIADTTTLVLLPLAASAGVKIAKLSGRGLGHTGGTIDKLESIPGFRTELSKDEFVRIVNEAGAAITGQSKDLVPADKKLYALRDVTATVDSIPLIAASIMSKKIAGGADRIVLDVKFGGGAFMKRYEDALELARIMVNIGKLAGRQTVAYVTDMDQPLGLAIGNGIEVIEAAETLKGRGHKDLLNLCLELGSEMMLLAGVEKDKEKARKKLLENIRSGKALEKFKEIVRRQGGDPDALEDYSLLPRARFSRGVEAREDGCIEKIDALRLGLTAMKLGAGRQKKDDAIDHSVGIWLCGKVGDGVEKGKPLAVIYANDEEKLQWAAEEVRGAFRITREKVETRRVIRARVTAENIEEF
ncbi:pyrimidine-nucleoside phosphorylase [Thermosediminibacter litoriperuensis]|uniref:Pyrimidine-nucleoside phosphorylase n=1 Tax=Thermosediminibacter litoriperuensis TaxID=291989 RepID=A0A5S5AVH4_9FIRM|nr:pyrimidine-nucleoside phosphorylase [Thermosediminibacter litoriperuensis]TYP56108.1 thymidine phosphorylase [Thermosediminibacter litoriperuensis]